MPHDRAPRLGEPLSEIPSLRFGRGVVKLAGTFSTPRLQELRRLPLDVSTTAPGLASQNQRFDRLTA